MSFSILRAATDDDVAALNASAVRFASRHGIDLPEDRPAGWLAADLDENVADASPHDVSWWKYKRRLWWSCAARALGHSGARAISHGYVGRSV